MEGEGAPRSRRRVSKPLSQQSAGDEGVEALASEVGGTNANVMKKKSCARSGSSCGVDGTAAWRKTLFPLFAFALASAFAAARASSSVRGSMADGAQTAPQATRPPAGAELEDSVAVPAAAIVASRTAFEAAGLVVTDWAYLSIFAFALSVVCYSTARVLKVDRDAKKNLNLKESLVDVQGASGLVFPLAGSVVLMLLFFFFNALSQLLAVMVSFSCVTSISFVFHPYIRRLLGRQTARRQLQLPWIGVLRLGDVILVLFSCAIVLCWLVSGHWMLNNLLGVALCVSAVSFFRFPSIKVSAITLSALFVYDIFWVFLSRFFFRENVMVSVATKKSKNPALAIAKKVNVPAAEKLIAQTLDLPMKLMVPRKRGFAMLGLGDIVLPGMLIAFAARFDHFKARARHEGQREKDNRRHWNLWWARNGYFLASFAGYAVGVSCAMFCSVYFQHAQPALLYIVPFTLGPVVVLGYHRGELKEIWGGIAKLEGSENTQGDDVEKGEEESSGELAGASHSRSDEQQT